MRGFYTKKKTKKKGPKEGGGGPAAPAAVRPGRATTYLLSGVLDCVCGASMVIAGGSSTRYYACGDNKKRGAHICPNKLLLREDTAREAILSGLRERLMSTGAVRFLRECIAKELAQHGRDFRDFREDRDEREQSLARTRGRIAQLVAFIANGDSSPAVRSLPHDAEGPREASAARGSRHQGGGGDGAPPPEASEPRGGSPAGDAP